MRDRLVSEFSLSAYDASWVTSTRAHASYFVAALESFDAGQKLAAAKQVANWMTSDLAAALNRDDLDIAQSRIAPKSLAKLLKRLADGTLSGKMAKEVFGYMWAGEGEADDIIGKRGMKQVSDSGAIEKMVDEVIAANPKSVEEYKAGKEKALNALFGQVMKASNKTANPAQVTEILKETFILSRAAARVSSRPSTIRHFRLRGKGGYLLISFRSRFSRIIAAMA